MAVDAWDKKAQSKGSAVSVKVLASGQEFCHKIRSGLGFQALVARFSTVPIEFDCRRADCGVCLIKVTDGLGNLSPMTKAEEDFLKAMGASVDERLACQCRIEGPVTLEVPPA